ncbi:MAG: valine--tRNA ligase [Acidobacteriia bacterium]|nr:valine--tRNA ligase [Terriglobia bacterium]
MFMTEISKIYDAKQVEKHWMDFWEKEGLFVANAQSTKPSFVIVIPPPNVTGSLHMGHMLVYTLHDIIVRWRRMQGFNTLWLPGTDHAGIATQNVVERQLEAEGKTRHDLGREAFEKKIWAWKEQSGNTILKQLRRLGGSCDWTRERFTLDKGLSKAVKEVFVRLYQEGLIYRGKRLINWCVRCQTALSDLEVKPEPTPGKLYYICYPIEGESGYVSIATTRPETMLGDTAVALNPKDTRHSDLVGKNVRVPLVDRKIPIIEDSFVDPEFGTGLVKVTPAHDPNDFEIGMRHDLDQISLINEDGSMKDAAGRFKGLDRLICRNQIVSELEQKGLIKEIKEHTHNVGRCERCKNIVEPLLSTQWFVKIKPLAEPAIRAIEEGQVSFIPENWTKTYFEWMHNIKDWCISRQLWWGHRIPAWYCDACGKVNVERNKPAKCSECSSKTLREETDVLDTWFSSGLWPFSTLGWPEETEDFKKFYPTSVLITGFDIIFFWVARMIMSGLKFTGKAPFQTVYINSLVRDAEGKKMSKSKGNVIDPLDLMDQYGTDAVRFTLAVMAAPGTDISLSTDKLLSYRSFTNKIWNAFRLVLMNQSDIRAQLPKGFDVATTKLSQKNREELNLIDRWILSRLNRVINQVNEELGSFRFHEACQSIYHFFWGELCDWYIEFIKPKIVAKQKDVNDQISYQTLMVVLDQSLKLMHPFMPFITEELWQRTSKQGISLATESFPVGNEDWVDNTAESRVVILQDVITKIRNLRAEIKLEPRKKISVNLATDHNEKRKLLVDNKFIINNLTRCNEIKVLTSLEKDKAHSVRSLACGVDIEIPLDQIMDPKLERERIKKEVAKVEKEMLPIEERLKNPEFISNAPTKVVELNQNRLAQFKEKLNRLREHLN